MILLELVVILEDDLEPGSFVSEGRILQRREDESEEGCDEIFGDVELVQKRDGQYELLSA